MVQVGLQPQHIHAHFMFSCPKNQASWMLINPAAISLVSYGNATPKHEAASRQVH